MAIAATYLSGASFSAPGDLAAQFPPGVRVKADCGPDGVRYATVTAAVHADSVTTVSVVPDAGGLTANLTAVWHGNDVPDSLIRATTDHPGAVELATAAEAVAGSDASRVPAAAALRQAYRSWLRDDVGRFAGIIPPAFNFFAPDLALPGTVAFSRASSAWRLNAAGALSEATTGMPRFGYAANGMPQGLLIEGAAMRLNLYAASPTTPETIAVSPQGYTLSFYGPGSVAISGTHTAMVAGAGAFPARVSYAFVSGIGTLTLTPTGDVRHLQLEAGSIATSPILGEGSQVARAADVATVSLSGIEWNAAEGTLYVAGRTPGGAPASNQLLAHIDDGTASNRFYVTRLSTRVIGCYAAVGGTITAVLGLGAVADNSDFRISFAWTANGFKACLNGGEIVTAGAGAIPASLTTLRIGSPVAAANMWNGPIRHLAMFPRALTAEQVQSMTL